MVGGAVETEVDTEGDGRPRRVIGAAVKADLFLISYAVRIYGALAVDVYLIRRLCLQFLENLLRLSFRCGIHLGTTRIQVSAGKLSSIRYLFRRTVRG